MNNLFITYFNVFLHPFEHNRSLRFINSNEDNNDKSLSFLEYVIASWPFVILNSFYTILGLFIFNMIDHSGPGGDYFFSGMWKLKGINIFYILILVAFFPLFSFFYTRFWRFIIRTFIHLFALEQRANEYSIKQVSNGSLCSNLFLLVPVFGPMIKLCSSFIYLYAGLKENLGLSRFQSLFILASPLIIVLMIAFLSCVSFLFLLFSFA